MKKTFLLPALLMLLTAPARAEIERLDTRAAPIRQSVSLRLDASRTAYSGSVGIDLRILEPTRSFTLHAEGQELERIALEGPDGPVIVSSERGGEGLLRLGTEEPLPIGEYTLEIDFTNDFNTQGVGLYRVEAGGHGYLYTQFESVDARKAFPCWDEPAHKIPWDLTLSVPEGDLVLANTPEAEVAIADGWRTVRFQTSKPLPSYLVALAAGPMETTPMDGLGVPGRIVTVRGQSHLAGTAARMTPPLLEALEEYFGRPYPYEKLDFIAVPEYWFGAMENPGAITYLDRILLVEDGGAGADTKRRLAEVVAHELAHQWFGNLVTMEWWDDLWLNESFASWMAIKTVEKVYPELRLDLQKQRDLEGVLAQDARPSTGAIRRQMTSTETLFDGMQITYLKGNELFNMLERWIGEEGFRKGVVEYINENQWGNATAADLFASLSKAAGGDVAGVMADFLDRSGYPLLRLEPDAEGGWWIAQEPFRTLGGESVERLWKVPVRMRYSAGGEVGVVTLFLDEPRESVELPRDVDWILPDDGADGYYRWTVPAPQLGALAASASEELDADERILFLTNLSGLLDAGVLSGAQYLAMLERFADDPEPEVSSMMLESLQKIENAFVPDALRDEFASYLRGALRPLLDRIGMERKPGEPEAVSLLRPRLLGFLGGTGQDPEVRAFAREKAESYLEDPASVDPAIDGTVMRIAARDGDAAFFERLQKAFASTEQPTVRANLLSALGNFEDPDLQHRALEYTLHGPIRPTELFQIPRDVAQSSDAGSALAFHWMTHHYDDIASRIPPAFTAFLPYFGGGCSTERLAETREFFSTGGRSTPGAMGNLEKVSDQVQECVRLRTREGESVARHLRTAAAAD